VIRFKEHASFACQRSFTQLCWQDLWALHPNPRNRVEITAVWKALPTVGILLVHLFAFFDFSPVLLYIFSLKK
jgi:hypothetical protein